MMAQVQAGQLVLLTDFIADASGTTITGHTYVADLSDMGLNGFPEVVEVYDGAERVAWFKIDHVEILDDAAVAMYRTKGGKKLTLFND